MIAVCVLTLMGVIVGCSDNVDPQYDPISSADRTLTINGSPRDTTINLTAGAATRVIHMKSNTRWTVRVVDGGGWCTTDVLSGKGDESFTINVLENIGKEERKCTIEVSAVDAEGQEDSNKSLQKSITVIQEESSVRISPSSLEAFPAAGSSQSFDIFANAAWTLDVSYENDNTAKFITLTPGENMSVGSDGKYEGNGDAKFSITLANNGSDASRLGYINLVSEVGKFTVEIRQNKSEYTFYVSPSERQRISAAGDSITFSVVSNSKWTVTGGDNVIFSKDSGEGGGKEESTVAIFGPNLTDGIRTYRLFFKPLQENYLSQEVIVEQEPFDLTFDVSPNTLSNVIMGEGGKYSINISSMFDWEIAEPPAWISVNPRKGGKSNDSSTISVVIDPNPTDSLRRGVIKVIPLPTQVTPRDSIYPEKVGKKTIVIPVQQYGGQEPAVSVPWLADDCTDSSATLKVNYYSPYVDIIAVGIEWRKETSNESDKWTSKKVEVSNSNRNKGTVAFQIDNLEYFTDYEARGFVEYVKDGKTLTKYGNQMSSFTTAGKFPNKDDNSPIKNTRSR